MPIYVQFTSVMALSWYSILYLSIVYSIDVWLVDRKVYLGFEWACLLICGGWGLWWGLMLVMQLPIFITKLRFINHKPNILIYNTGSYFRFKSSFDYPHGFCAFTLIFTNFYRLFLPNIINLFFVDIFAKQRKTSKKRKGYDSRYQIDRQKDKTKILILTFDLYFQK